MPYKNLIIHETASVKDALKLLDTTAEKVLIVTDKNTKLLGTISDGDIRRYILREGRLDKSIKEVYNRKPTFVYKGKFLLEDVRKTFIEKKISLIPVLDHEDKLADFITWSSAFTKEELSDRIATELAIPVVIMAGGKGTRLEPFTKILPKPLIPIGDKSILEIIIDEFRKYGINKYYLTLNYKGEMIEAYFKSVEKTYEIEYIWEKDFYGTAGSLKLLEARIDDTFIVSNCDVIVRADFSNVINWHKEKGSCLTILSSIQHYKIPYGVVNFVNGGQVTDVHEKPEYTFTVNTGVYVLSKEALQFIPEKTNFDMTHLISALIEQDKKVFTYPVNEQEYIDIGQWDEYRKTVEKISFT